MTAFDNLDEATPDGTFRDIIDGAGVDRATGSAVDSDGNVYVVGTVQDDLAGFTLQAETDTYLRKYDSAGQLIWSRLLGAHETTQGTTIAVEGTGDERYLKITADDGQIIRLTPASGDLDALVGLGLKEVTLAGDAFGLADGAETPIFSLGLIDNMDLLSDKGVADAAALIENAMRELRDMYQFMVTGRREAETLPPISEANALRIAELQSALYRVELAVQNGRLGAQMLINQLA